MVVYGGKDRLETTEEGRLTQDREKTHYWRRWGPYLSERQWATVREDYSANGDAWSNFPFEHARSRVYRWGEDGIAGVSDNHQFECISFAFWNGKDDILKERLFGLTGPQGNHGEDVKEEYFYLDNTPTHSYMKYLYKYPQAKFPYEQLIEKNAKRSKLEPEYEIADTGVFDQGKYFDIFIEMAKETDDDLLFRVTAYNRGPDAAPLHIIPQLWFRNTWDWGYDQEQGQGILVNGVPPKEPAHKLHELPHGIVQADHWRLGTRYLQYAVSPGFGDDPEDESDDDVEPELLFTDNVTNKKRLYNVENDNGYKYTKDGFHDYIIEKDKDAINPNKTGTKVGGWYAFDRDGGIPAGDFVSVRFKFSKGKPTEDLDEELFDRIMDKRQDEADDFYFHISPLVINDELRNIQRQALAGMLWSKQFYYLVQTQWEKGDPSQPPPPPERKHVRNSAWKHLHIEDILSLPDKWEYPFFAVWDTAFHCIPLAMVDPDFAKKQLDLMTREWYMHPNGQIPAYEWNFSDVNPPVHAWATFRVYKMERKMYGREDVDFLERVFQKLLLNFTWWVNRKDVDGQNVFEGGFLGLDNIGLFNRSEPLPTGGTLQQADSTGWMAFFCLQMMSIALELAKHRSVYEDIASKFFEHFILIADAMTFKGVEGEKSLWNEKDDFYYDAISWGGPWSQELPVRSLVGLIPLYASVTLEPEMLDRFKKFSKRVTWFIKNRPSMAARNMASMEKRGNRKRILLSLVNQDRLEKILCRMLDEKEFLSEHGIRSLSKYHKEHPYSMNVNGQEFTVDYVPGDSNSGLFGGNSNWRGPIWFPTNFLLIEALQRFYLYYGDELKIEYPTGSQEKITLAKAAEKLQHRLIGLFAEPSEDGSSTSSKRAYNGGSDLHDKDEHFKDYILFYEYFHADTGRGLGSKHQCGWTGLIAKLIHDTGITYRIPEIEKIVDPIANAELFFDDVVSKSRYHSRRGSANVQRRFSSKSLNKNLKSSQSSQDIENKENVVNEASRELAEHIRAAVQKIKLNVQDEPDTS